MRNCLLLVILAFTGLGADCSSTPKTTPPFFSIPNSEHSGLIVKNKILSITDSRHVQKKVHRPYNPSIIELPANSARSNPQSKYLLSFRYEYGQSEIEREAFIGFIEMDENFEQSSDVFQLNTDYHDGKSRAEDARLFVHEREIHIIFNDTGLEPTETKSHLFRMMHLGKIAFKDNRWLLIKNLRYDHQRKRIDKNWTPFFYEGEMYYSWFLQPHTVLKPLNNTNEIIEYSNCEGRKANWKFGGPRGGTPAYLLNKENYIGFFHSSVLNTNNDFRQYYMGAYTFDTSPPFCMKKTSQWPIYFPGIYAAPEPALPYIDWVPGLEGILVTFPGGFVETKNGGKPQYVVAYGAGDSQCNLMWIDKEKLLNSMVPVIER